MSTALGSSTYPTTLDVITDPDPVVRNLHERDAIQAIQLALGVTGSTDATSIIYGINNHIRSFAALTYATTMAPTSAINKIVATDTVAFTISNPVAAAAGQSMIFDIVNSSGGSLGTVTWGNAFKLAGSLTNPANGKRKTIAFYYDGTNWVETARAAADI